MTDTRTPSKSATPSTGVSRRTLLKGGAAVAGAAVGSGAITGFPTIWAQNIKNVTLRQFGTGVSNLNAVADKVKEDLGFTLQMTALDSRSGHRRPQPRFSRGPAWSRWIFRTPCRSTR